MPDVFVGIGSNIEPERHLRWALERLERQFGPLQRSDVYRSPAFGFEGPDFLNMVVGFECSGHVDDVEQVLSSLENECGRADGDRSGSRTLDLDLLLFGERIDAARRLPRTDILIYPFVLKPLNDLTPERVHPVTGRTMRAAWKVLGNGASDLVRLRSLGD
jgi:2-amino-4-hydroxy-6-hydroxymethyldihydropteridine diphosphokinase